MDFFTENFNENLHRSNKHFKKYKNFYSKDLITKVDKWCNSLYMSSTKYAEMREVLRNRIGFIKRYQQKPFDLKEIKDYSSVGYEIICEYAYHCKFECGDMPVILDSTNHHLNRYLKLLQKKLSTSLNKLDRFWGYYGVWGYGINYGINHIEIESYHIKTLRKLNMAMDCLRKVAEETNNKDCKEVLDLIYKSDITGSFL